jgi:hypothetical protein
MFRGKYANTRNAAGERSSGMSFPVYLPEKNNREANIKEEPE